MIFLAKFSKIKISVICWIIWFESLAFYGMLSKKFVLFSKWYYIKV